MNKLKKVFSCFSIFELGLWIASLTLISIFFFIFDGKDYLAFSASLVGATALIFCAKGNPIGQALIIAFGILYGVKSYSCAYYGEMITYVGMTLPMAVIALITWLKNPFNGNRSQVKIREINLKELILAILLTGLVTLIFYFILKFLGTSNLIVSTISVATSFIAVFLTFRRSPYYALAYGANDVVLIILWANELASNKTAISVLTCFIVFFANDLYGFINWRKMFKKQNKEK